MQNEGMIAGNELRIRRRTRSLADLGAALEQRLRHLGIRAPMPNRFVLRDEIVVSAGQGGSAQRDQGQKTEERVHGRKFVAAECILVTPSSEGFFANTFGGY
jgi:hypothetical protein